MSVLALSTELEMPSVPVRSLLTKKIAPPPSLALLSAIRLPHTRRLKVLPSL
jgi:hypothetical protein